jgi:Zn-finger nucleic acid-binding protein
MTYRDRPLQCPRCGTELVRSDTRDAWRCERCRGALLGVGEVARRLVEVAPDLAPDGNILALPTLGRRTTAPLIKCPACAAEMKPVFLGGLDVDRCYHDELIWFDMGELDHVLEVAASQRDARHPSWLLRIVRALVG